MELYLTPHCENCVHKPRCNKSKMCEWCSAHMGVEEAQSIANEFERLKWKCKAQSEN